MSENGWPSVDKLYGLIRQQQDRIEELERLISPRTGGDDHPPAAVTSAATEVADPQPPGMSRGDLLRTAAVGAAGVAVTVLLADPPAALATTGQPVTFTSASTTPTVTVQNTGTGPGMSVKAVTKSPAVTVVNSSWGSALSGSSNSGIASASAIMGSLTKSVLGKNAAAVLGVITGTEPTSAAVAGSHATNGMGVYGTSQSGIGVEGDSASTAADAIGVHGLIESTSPGGFSAGIRGDNNGDGGLGIGVYGTQNGAGYGVYGVTPSGYGVYGSSAAGTGVVGGSSSGVGVSGSSYGSYGVSAVTYSSADNASAISATMSSATPGTGTSAVSAFNYDTSTTGIGVHGQQAGGGYGVWGEADGSQGYGVYGVSTDGYGLVGRGGTYSIYGVGDFAVAGGTKAAIVPFADGQHRTFYCLESPECWFEDFGSAGLKRGSSVVSLDPKFAEAVETGEYYVFLSPEGDCKGLFVTAKTATGFQVHEQEGGTSNIRFSYRIVALRADVDAPRLAPAPNLGAPKSSGPARPAAPEPLRGQR